MDRSIEEVSEDKDLKDNEVDKIYNTASNFSIENTDKKFNKLAPKKQVSKVSDAEKKDIYKGISNFSENPNNKVNKLAPLPNKKQPNIVFNKTITNNISSKDLNTSELKDALSKSSLESIIEEYSQADYIGTDTKKYLSNIKEGDIGEDKDKFLKALDSSLSLEKLNNEYTIKILSSLKRSVEDAKGLSKDETASYKATIENLVKDYVKEGRADNAQIERFIDVLESTEKVQVDSNIKTAITDKQLADVNLDTYDFVKNTMSDLLDDIFNRLEDSEDKLRLEDIQSQFEEGLTSFIEVKNQLDTELKSPLTVNENDNLDYMFDSTSSKLASMDSYLGEHIANLDSSNRKFVDELINSYLDKGENSVDLKDFISVLKDYLKKNDSNFSTYSKSINSLGSSLKVIEENTDEEGKLTNADKIANHNKAELEKDNNEKMGEVLSSLSNIKDDKGLKEELLAGPSDAEEAGSMVAENMLDFLGKNTGIEALQKTRIDEDGNTVENDRSLVGNMYRGLKSKDEDTKLEDIILGIEKSRESKEKETYLEAYQAPSSLSDKKEKETASYRKDADEDRANADEDREIAKKSREDLLNEQKKQAEFEKKQAEEVEKNDLAKERRDIKKSKREERAKKKENRNSPQSTKSKIASTGGAVATDSDDGLGWGTTAAVLGAGVIAAGTSAYVMYDEMSSNYDQYQMADNDFDRDKAVARTGGGLAGATAGALAGAEVGGTVGAWLGSLSMPLVGTFIGAGGGAFVGGIVGAGLGLKMGAGVTDYIHETMAGPLDKIPDDQKDNPFTAHEYLTQVYIPKMQEAYKAETDPDKRKDIEDDIEEISKTADELLKPDNLEDWMESQVDDAGLSNADAETQRKFLTDMMSYKQGNELYYNAGMDVINDPKGEFSESDIDVGRAMHTMYNYTPIGLIDKLISKPEETPEVQLQKAAKMNQFNSKDNTLGKDEQKLSLTSGNQDKNFNALVDAGIVNDDWGDNSIGQGGYDKLKQLPQSVIQELVDNGNLNDKDQTKVKSLLKDMDSGKLYLDEKKKEKLKELEDKKNEAIKEYNPKSGESYIYSTDVYSGQVSDFSIGGRSLTEEEFTEQFPNWKEASSRKKSIIDKYEEDKKAINSETLEEFNKNRSSKSKGFNTPAKVKDTEDGVEQGSDFPQITEMQTRVTKDEKSRIDNLTSQGLKNPNQIAVATGIDIRKIKEVLTRKDTGDISLMSTTGKYINIGLKDKPKTSEDKAPVTIINNNSSSNLGRGTNGESSFSISDTGTRMMALF